MHGIYMSECTLATPAARDALVQFMEAAQLNTVVMDIQDYTGRTSFVSTDPQLTAAASPTCHIDDLASFITSLHKKHIYVVGRITVFQNPYYAGLHPEQAVQKKGGGVWKDYKGIAFVDVGATPYWDYVVALGKASYALGADELNFDYVRFPSDGPMAQAVYSYETNKSKADALEAFFSYLHDRIHFTGAYMSADLFGMAATNKDDLGIGQVLERALPYFDYIDPMVYPSHYPAGYHGFAHVDAHAYDIVHDAMLVAGVRAEAPTTTVASLAETILSSTTPPVYTKEVYPRSAIRPWLQSFDYPVHYTPEMVEAQIRAAADAGINSYIFWDASNTYTALRSVLTPQ